MQMGLVAGRDLQGGGLDLDESLRLEPAPDARLDAACAPAGTAAGRHGCPVATRGLGLSRALAWLRCSLAMPEKACRKRQLDLASLPPLRRVQALKPPERRIDGGEGYRKLGAQRQRARHDGKLCVVMKAENIHPGKGTPVTHLDMRRISDGVKITERYRTTDQVERAYLEDKTYNYLYEDDMGFIFMEPETFEQITVPKEMIGDQAVYLQENMAVQISACTRACRSRSSCRSA